MSQLDLLAVSSDITQSQPSLPQKASGAYKTISEVADALDVPQHVLRFWESNFPQVKPSRMRGARRYYRPEDVEALKMVKMLLYTKGYTIKGAKKVLRKGVNSEARALPPAPSAIKPAVKKEFDTKPLVSELRELKSMLTSLL